jgi:hypothetical protein
VSCRASLFLAGGVGLGGQAAAGTELQAVLAVPVDLRLGHVAAAAGAQVFLPVGRALHLHLLGHLVAAVDADLALALGGRGLLAQSETGLLLLRIGAGRGLAVVVRHFRQPGVTLLRAGGRSALAGRGLGAQAGTRAQLHGGVDGRERGLAAGVALVDAGHAHFALLAQLHGGAAAVGPGRAVGIVRLVLATMNTGFSARSREGTGSRKNSVPSAGSSW